MLKELRDIQAECRMQRIRQKVPCRISGTRGRKEGEAGWGAVLLLMKFKLIEKFQLTSVKQKSALSKRVQTCNSEY